jgi:hypothetical protein
MGEKEKIGVGLTSDEAYPTRRKSSAALFRVRWNPPPRLMAEANVPKSRQTWYLGMILVMSNEGPKYAARVIR